MSGIDMMEYRRCRHTVEKKRGRMRMVDTEREKRQGRDLFGCLLWRNWYGLPIQIIGGSEVCRRAMCEVWYLDRRKIKV